MFELFDKLIILADGRMVYFGPAKASIPYFSQLGYPVPALFNPLDHFLELVDEHQEEEDPKALRNMICDKFDYEKVKQISDSMGIKDKEYTVAPLKGNKKNKYRANWFMQFAMLFYRGFRKHIGVFIGNFIVFLIIAALSAIVWADRGYTEGDIADRIGLLFFMAMNWFAFPLFGAINDFVPERPVFKKERSSAVYRVSSYFLSRATSSLPLDLINPIVFSCIVYWSANLNSGADRFFIFICIIFVSYFVGNAIGLCIAAFVDRVEHASAPAMAIFFVCMLVSGFYSRDGLE
jgi:hypothetical protein